MKVVNYAKQSAPPIPFPPSTLSPSSTPPLAMSAGMATIAVKVLGPQTLDMGGKAVIPVEFDSLEIYIYYRDGKPMVAGRATAIRVADKL